MIESSSILKNFDKILKNCAHEMKIIPCVHTFKGAVLKSRWKRETMRVGKEANVR
jgi:hypothetical protein